MRQGGQRHEVFGKVKCPGYDKAESRLSRKASLRAHGEVSFKHYPIRLFLANREEEGGRRGRERTEEKHRAAWLRKFRWLSRWPMRSSDFRTRQSRTSGASGVEDDVRAECLPADGTRASRQGVMDTRATWGVRSREVG
jgi:hypothetical protein